MICMNKLVIFGAGGHYNSIKEFIDRDKFELVGTFDDNGGSLGTISQGLQTIVEYNFAFVAIGNDCFREKLINQIESKITVINVIAKDATISDSTKLDGGGIFIGSGAYVGPNVKIGTGSIVNTRAIVEHDCNIGNYCQISPASVICGMVTLNDYVYVGANATIIQCIDIASKVVLGAGAVAVKNIETQGTYVGIPCKEI